MFLPSEEFRIFEPRRRTRGFNLSESRWGKVGDDLVARETKQRRIGAQS